MNCIELREAVETWPELDRLRRLREARRLVGLTDDVAALEVEP